MTSENRIVSSCRRHNGFLFFLLALTIAFCWFASPQDSIAASAGGRSGRLHSRTPWQDMTVVIANANVPESMKLAKEYMSRRGIPEHQLFAARCPKRENISRKEFNSTIWRPLKNWALDMGYLMKVDEKSRDDEIKSPYMSGILWFVLMYGMPLSIDEHNANSTGESRPLSERNAASVDSELATFPIGPESIAGPIPNPLFVGKGNTAWPLKEPNNDIMTLVCRLDGPTYKIARSLMDHTDEIEEYGQGGYLYIDGKGLKEGIEKPIDDALRELVKLSNRDGMMVKYDEELATFSPDHEVYECAGYVGRSTKDINGPFRKPDFRFLPGAVVYHIHPLSAKSLRTKDQFWAGPMLAKGAGFVVGNVFDPGIDGYTQPDILYHSMTTPQRPAAENFIVSAWGATPYLSWSTVVIGEPQVRPYYVSRQKINRLAKARNDEKASAILHPMRYRMIASPDNKITVMTVRDVMSAKEPEQTPWEHPDLYEFLGDAWSTTSDLMRSPAAAVNAYLKAADIARYPSQRSRVRLSAAHALLSVTSPREVEYVTNADPRFKDGLVPFAKSVLEKAIEQDATVSTTLPAYLLLAKLYKQDYEKDKYVALLEKAAQAVPDTFVGRNSAGELWILDRNRTNPVQTLFAGKTKTSPEIDGVRDDTCWKEIAFEMPDEMREADDIIVPSPIQAAAVYSDEKLYLFVKCPKTPLAASVLAAREENQSKDAVEILLSPARDYATGQSLTIQKDGTVSGVNSNGREWTFFGKAVATEEDDLWSAEIAIPFDELEEADIQQGSVIGFNFRRRRALENKNGSDTITTTWTGRYGDLEEIDQFGYLAFE